MSLVERLRATALPPPAQRREIRRKAGASLREVAEELGVTALTVSKWERAIAGPKPDHAVAYRRLLQELQVVAEEIGSRK